MRRAAREELRVTGMGLRRRFVLTMTLALAVVLAGSSFLIHRGATNIADSVFQETVSGAVRFTHENRPFVEGAKGWRDASGVELRPFRYGPDSASEGMLYRHETSDPTLANPRYQLLVPRGKDVGHDMLGLIVGITIAVLLVGGAVTMWVAGQVVRPIHLLIEDVRQIAKGDLEHKTHAVGAGELQVLARAIDRMTGDLADAQDAEFELSLRERELGLAAGVREALLPLTTPLVEGYDIGASFLSSQSFGGDFHDFIELPDGRVGLLVCDVGGEGVPAALVGATARAYLRGELERGGEIGEAFSRVNHWLADDVRRGMFVTALYARLDPAARVATVACAGHRIPLLRLAAEDNSLRVVHPEGIAFGFDAGPVFDRRLQVVDVPLEPGDRLLLANSAPVELENPEGRELGEKAFYARVAKHGRLDTPQFLKALRRDLERHAGTEELPTDVSLVTLSRDA